MNSCIHNSFICKCNNNFDNYNTNNIIENKLNSTICQHNSFLCKCKYNLLNENELKIAIVGTGFVGNAIINSLKIKNILNIISYDKYLNGGIGKIDDILNAHIIILSLPTPFSEIHNTYDLNPIIETLTFLYNNNFLNPIIIKSTILPETTNNLSSQFPSLNLIHNPEFLTQKTAFEDFHNQSHIVLGKSNNCSSFAYNFVIQFYKKYYPNAILSECSSNESESMKIFCNSFYSVKIQFFNELFLICNKNNTSFNNVKNLMLKNGWINPMHTNVPGNDKQLSYGGYCFPKDTNALLNYMKEKNSEYKILEACINERNELRSDNINIIKSNN
jgi:nucleotide sugar dehydrogenase